MRKSYVRLAESGGVCKLFSILLPPTETFSSPRRLTGIQQKSKGANAMNDLHFNPSALLIVGMLIGVFQTLVRF